MKFLEEVTLSPVCNLLLNFPTENVMCMPLKHEEEIRLKNEFVNESHVLYIIGFLPPLVRMPCVFHVYIYICEFSIFIYTCSVCI